MSKNTKKVITFKKMSLVGTARAVKGLKGKCFSLESTFCGLCFNKAKCLSGNGPVAEQQRVRDAEAFIKRSKGKSKSRKTKVAPFYVKCVDDANSLNITVGRRYLVLGEDPAGYILVGDRGPKCVFPKILFTVEPLQGVTFKTKTTAKPVSVTLRPNFVKALKDKVPIHVDTTPEISKELQDICFTNGIFWYSGSPLYSYEGTFFIRDTAKGYCMVLGGGGIRYRPETDTFDQVTQVQEPTKKVVVTPAPSEDSVVATKTCKNCGNHHFKNCPYHNKLFGGTVCDSWTDKPIEKVEVKEPDLGMTGKCHDNFGLSLTLGKQYKILEITRFGFKIKNDLGNIEEYNKGRFESTEPVETKEQDTKKVTEKEFWEYVLQNDLKDYPGCRFGMCAVCPYAEDTGACLIPSKYPLLDRCNNVAMQSMARKQLEKSGLMTPSEIKSSEEMQIFFPARNVGKYFLLNLNEKESAHLKKLLDSGLKNLSVQWSDPCPGFLQLKVPDYVWIVSDDGLLRQKSSTLNIKVIDQALKVEMVNSCGESRCFDFCCTIDEAYALYKAGENK